MTHFFLIPIWSLLFFFCAAQEVPLQPAATTEKKIEFNIPIRVLIEEQPIRNVQWTLDSKDGFILYDQDKAYTQSYTPKCVITVKTIRKKPLIFINGKRQQKSTILIKPRIQETGYKGNVYMGAFVVILQDNMLQLINHLDIEDYVACVLPHESWPGWPDEFNRAFCVVIRTYGLSKLLEERELAKKRGVKLPYDIKSTNIHQVYNGLKNNAAISRIIDETKGLILSYNQKPILAMFDSCCGGVVPSKIAGFDFNKAPYLQRDYPCLYCQNCKSFNWQAKYSALEIENTLKKEFPQLRRLRHMQVTAADDAGIVKAVQLKMPRERELTGKKCKSLFKKLKSCCFTVEKKGQEYIFSGAGLGHHMGMCQWGAYALVKQGWKYKDILQFYYPGTTLMRLQSKKNEVVATGDAHAKL